MMPAHDFRQGKVWMRCLGLADAEDVRSFMPTALLLGKIATSYQSKAEAPT